MRAVDYRNPATLLTGASAGIGVEFARRLAARGSHLVLVARREQRLTQLAEELQAAHGIRAVTVPLDLSRPGAGAALADQLRNRGIRLTSLVNCAGFGTYGPFHTEDTGRLIDEIAVDVTAVVDITRAFIADLRAAGTGVVIKVAATDTGAAREATAPTAASIARPPVRCSLTGPMTPEGNCAITLG